MNHEELQTSPSSFSAQRVPAVNSHHRLSDGPHHPQKGSSLSSTPSELDWVSPFTLPPLPAFRRARGHQPASPEQPRQRDGSGAYYAAAWGSPYSSPSPEARPPRNRAGRRSIDWELSSPPYSNQSAVSPLSQINRHSIDAGDVTSPARRRRLIKVRKLQEETSERPNWLSDSEDSGLDDSFREQEHTPRSQRVVPTLGASPAQLVRQAGHLANASVDTITQDTFRSSRLSRPKRQAYRSISHSMSLAEEGEPGPALETSPLLEEKALPNVPERTFEYPDAQRLESPTSPSRPRPNTMQSFQRPKKKVTWKGKTCVIALPLTDRDSAGLPSILTPQEVREKVDALNAEGYHTKGFQLTDFIEDESGLGSGHSRPLYPDPWDLQSERQLRQYQVYIPNQEEWNQWVQWLQEEKLRALGVTPSSSEPPASTTSPFSNSMSRTSSRYAGLVCSPPIGPISPMDSSLRATSNPFSPAFSASSGMGSQIGSGTSSQYNGYPVPAHAHKQSIGFAPGQGRGQSPRDFSPNQLSPAIRSPTDDFNRRQTGFSPINPQGMQSLGEVLSPISQPPSAGPSPNIIADMVDYMSVPRDPNQPRSASHEPLPSSVSRPSLPHQSSSLPRTPNFDHLSRPPIEIQHPTPRSHRHNLSVALQKEIDEAEAVLESQRGRYSIDLPIQKPAFSASNEKKSAPEEPQVELPILNRPELEGTDDKSDIETNPSIAASPLLMDDQNPFGNWQALSEAARGDTKRPALAPKTTQLSYKSHKAQPSVSKLNVEAKEFNPNAGFDSTKFASGNFNPFTAPSRPPMSLVRKEGDAKQTQESKLSVEASAFNPGAASFSPVIPASQSLENKPPSTFRIPSSTFNVEAPEFNPNKSPVKAIKSAFESTSESESQQASIFGKVTIDLDSKVTRRTSKALPILRPRSNDGPSGGSSAEESQGEVEEDEGGRPIAPTDRAKRARRQASDGDRSPVFANSAPFAHRHSRILSEIVDDAESEKSFDEKPKEKPVDGWAYIPAGTPEPPAPGTISPLREQSSELPVPSSPFTFRDDQEAVMFSEARPRSYSQSSLELEKEEREVVDSDPVSAAVSSPLRRSTSSHKSRSPMSALAEPFMLDSSRSSQAARSPQPRPPTSPKTRKITGLGASRWAATPSPSPSPPLMHSSRLSSPPLKPEMISSPPLHSAVPSYSYIRPEEFVESELNSEPRDVKVSGSLDESAKSSVSIKHEDPLEDTRSVESHDFALEHAVERSQSPNMSTAEDAVPSFEEIDAVMQHLDRNPELGIERENSPFQSTPLVDMRLGPTFRSDAPSPSPRRRDQHESHDDAASAIAYGLGIGVHQLSTGKEEVSDWNDTLSATEEDKLQSRAQFFDGHVNDIVDGVLENRLGPLERTLQTIQHSIALMATRPPAKTRRSMSTDARESDADDEDEYNAFEGFSQYRSRSPEAKRGNRKTSRIRAAVAEGMAAYRDSAPPQPQVDLSEILAELAEMRHQLRERPSMLEQPQVDMTQVLDELAEMRHQLRSRPSTADETKVDISQVLDELAEMRQQFKERPPAPANDHQEDMKAALDAVISSHPRLRGSRVQQDHEPSESKYKIHVDGLNALLKAEQERAGHETRLRKKADEEIELLKRALSDAEAEAVEHREASDAAQRSLEAFLNEKDAYRSLEQDLELVNRKNEELEMNLDEYRKYKVELQDDIDEERENNVELKRVLQEVKERLDDRNESCKTLRNKVDRLQDQISLAIRDLGSEQSQWRTREGELLTKMSIIENALDQAARQREQVELDYHDLSQQHKEAILFRDRFENLQQDLAVSRETTANLQNESRQHQNTAFASQKDLDHLIANRDADVVTATARLTAELEGARSQLESYRNDSEARVVRLQSRLDSAELDVEEQKAKHDTISAETAEAHTRAFQEAAEKHETAVESQQAAHQSHLADLRERHTRAMHNSSDDRHRLEHQFNEKLSLSEDKVRHLEGKLLDVEERLEITKSAARAAVEAATVKGGNLPTPANSVVASPPQRAASASLSLVNSLPEKIPVQSLRESIMVLQDQLQNREQQIEKLEAELAGIDKEMPNRLKERETEATWLRELLAVRVDDIDDIIATVATPGFDREHVKDAAIRLKANLQMEQQIKERAAQSGGLTANLPLPSMSSLAAYAQSPRQALPLAAAAAWGNFRKVRDMGGEKINEYLSQSTVGTPSKSSIQGSPASLLSGIMTPPNTSARTPSVERDVPPPAMRPLAAAAAARKAQSGSGLGSSDAQPRPLRGFSTKPRALGAKREIDVDRDERILGGAVVKSPTSPHTPAPKRMDSMDVGRNDDLTGDVDDDARSLEGRE